ncbi:hypothetical protein XU18_2226 [Perkinsela sp. CCAP 1560/4]|nr:hypothetical protein XU18_2226 [Perkinsela sp. CCAP 1560/4]|eukprot:KNH07049.1 hypothetical protein XU18_2226 [Perkinsela sp. CCAP 1560/4]
MHNILHRIFKDKSFPQSGTREELHNFFEKSVREFEDGSFLKETALPAVNGEPDLHEKLYQHRTELLLIKYWKRNCIPCLSVAEMYKEAEKRCAQEKLPVRFYSINTKETHNKDVVDNQLVEGTPTIQKFHDFAQVGEDIRATNIDDLMSTIYQELRDISPLDKFAGASSGVLNQ